MFVGEQGSAPPSLPEATPGKSFMQKNRYILPCDRDEESDLDEGPMGYMVEDRHLRRALLGAMDAEARITQRSGERVVAQSAGRVTLASGDTIRAALVVGADGRQSGTAQRAGITRTGWGYGQTAIVCAVDITARTVSVKLSDGTEKTAKLEAQAGSCMF